LLAQEQARQAALVATQQAEQAFAALGVQAGDALARAPAGPADGPDRDA
jgi:hypothetical protein